MNRIHVIHPQSEKLDFLPPSIPIIIPPESVRTREQLRDFDLSTSLHHGAFLRSTPLDLSIEFNADTPRAFRDEFLASEVNVVLVVSTGDFFARQYFVSPKKGGSAR